MAMIFKSEAIGQGEAIPRAYTCEGQNISPPIVWDNLSKSAKSLVLIVDDPDSPDPKAPKMTYVHWVLYNIPANSKGLGAAIHEADLPRGTLQGKNDWGRVGYAGPCPPIGIHRYFFKLYALDTVLPDLHEPTKAQVESKMQNHILEMAQFYGTYVKGKKH